MNYTQLCALRCGAKVKDIVTGLEGTVSAIVCDESVETSEVHAESEDGESLSIFPDELEVIEDTNAVQS